MVLLLPEQFRVNGLDPFDLLVALLDVATVLDTAEYDTRFLRNE